ncbi:MAG: glycosyltransferase family 2 protein [Desulfocapsa sp.]|nr:glycosyltransferase family 2 protein [Desulfocapsa sp.]
MTGISVIIPTYNRRSFLERALSSVLQQSHPCNEILVIDDGSDDDTYDFVDAVSSSCQTPVHYFYQNNNGPAAARNRGIREAKYSYLAFLDSDDHWLKNKLEIQYRSLLNRPEMKISHTRERWLRRGEHLNQKNKHIPGDGDIFRRCLQLCAVGMSTVMVKRELFTEVGMFNENLRCCEDYDLWLRTSSRYPFLLIDSPLTVKEGGREDQVSFQYRVGMDKLRIASILDLLDEQCLSTLQLVLALEELQRKCLVYGSGCVKHKQSGKGKQYLELAEWAETELLDNPSFPLVIRKFDNG